MPKVHHRKARKDYPDSGISKGDMYYYTSMKTGPRSSRVLRQLTPFRRSQLTTSEFLSQIYDIEDALPEVSEKSEIEAIRDQLQQLAEDEREKYDNMPEGLQQGETGCMLEERATGCEEAADELTEIIQRIEEAEDEKISEEDMAAEIAERVSEGEDPEDVHAELLEESMQPDVMEDLLEEARELGICYG